MANNLTTYPKPNAYGEQPNNLPPWPIGHATRTTLAYWPRYVNNRSTFNLTT